MRSHGQSYPVTEPCFHRHFQLSALCDQSHPLRFNSFVGLSGHSLVFGYAEIRNLPWHKMLLLDRRALPWSVTGVWFARVSFLTLTSLKRDFRDPYPRHRRTWYADATTSSHGSKIFFSEVYRFGLYIDKLFIAHGLTYHILSLFFASTRNMHYYRAYCGDLNLGSLTAPQWTKCFHMSERHSCKKIFERLQNQSIIIITVVRPTIIT